MNDSSDTSFFDGFDESKTVEASSQPLDLNPTHPSLTKMGTGLSVMEDAKATEEETKEEKEEEDRTLEEETEPEDVEEDQTSEANEVKALNEAEVDKAKAATGQEEEEENKLYPVIDDSYEDLGACQVNITYSLLPTKGESTNSGEREVLVTIYDHDDPPLIRECRLQDLGELPKIVKDMMAELAKTLPSRAEARAKEKQEEKEEREKRKARLAKSRTGKTPAKPVTKTPATKEPAGQIDLFGDLMGK